MNKKIFSIVILFTLIMVSLFTFGACQTESEQPIEIIATTEHGIKLSHRLYAVTINGVSYPSVDLTATISPADAPDKTVTWSVEWGDGAELASKAVTDYVTVTPDSSNGLKATVVCKKAFRGNVIVVKVKTKDGGYIATCSVTFEGKPQDIKVNNGSTAKCNYLGRNTYSVALENVFDDVGDDFYNNITVKTFSWGGTYYGGTYNTTGQSWSDLQTRNIADLQNASMYISATYADKVLTVSNFRSLIESAYISSTGSSQGALFTGYVKSNVNMYVDVVLVCADMEKTVRVNFTPITLSVNNGMTGTCDLGSSATFDVAIGNKFGTLYEDVKFKSFAWGGTYTGQNWSSNPSGSGYYGDKKTCNVVDLLQDVADYFDVTYSNGKLTVNNKTSMLTWSLYTSESSGGYSTFRYNCPVENLNVYLDIVLAYGDTTTTFRVNFTSNVNSVSLNNDSIIF